MKDIKITLTWEELAALIEATGMSHTRLNALATKERTLEALDRGREKLQRSLRKAARKGPRPKPIRIVAGYVAVAPDGKRTRIIVEDTFSMDKDGNTHHAARIIE